MVGRDYGGRRRNRADTLVSQYAPVAWYPYEDYVCVVKGGEENVDALNKRVAGPDIEMAWREDRESE